MKKYTTEKIAETRELITFDERNRKGEKIQVELTKCVPDLKNKNTLMNLWKKNGSIKKVLPSYWCVNTYVTNEKGESWGYYNPTIKLSEDGKRQVLNFDVLFEATEENKNKLLELVEKLAFV